MFASIGSCCQGVKSTYKVVVGRSKKVWGPYKDKTGKPMLKNGYSLVIGANDHFVGNGHGSQIIRDDAGQDYEGWPYVEGGSPSYETQKAPVFNN